MNQKQLIDHGKSNNIPISILKWIWKNLDKIDDIIDVIVEIRDRIRSDKPKTLGGGDDINPPTEPDPGTTPPAP